MFGDKKIWNKLVKNGMAQDFSWSKSAEQYVKLYKNILDGDKMKEKTMNRS